MLTDETVIFSWRVYRPSATLLSYNVLIFVCRLQYHLHGFHLFGMLFCKVMSLYFLVLYHMEWYVFGCECCPCVLYAELGR